MSKKNIKIEVLTDLYYARFIAIWRPEEETDYIAPENDTRTEQQKNIPYFLVISSMYSGRQEVVGNSPVVPSQHPIPVDFLKQQVRHISYMFANELGIFQPPSKAHAAAFLSKMRLGYKKIKELNVTVAPAQGSITLKDLKDSLEAYSDNELKAINVMTIGENPIDAYSKNLDDFIHTAPQSTTPQYISITKLTNVYDMADPYIKVGNLPSVEDISNSYAPGTENETMTIEQMNLTENAIANNEADLALLKTYDEMTEEEQMASDTLVTDTHPIFSKEEVQQQLIKNLQAKIKELEK